MANYLDTQGTKRLVDNVKTLIADGYVASGTINSGDTIADADLISAMEAHLPVTINGVRCQYQTDDGTALEYVTFTLSGTDLHVNLIALDKTTHAITFNAFTVAA